jgi:hypothetical protein
VGGVEARKNIGSRRYRGSHEEKLREWDGGQEEI